MMVARTAAVAQFLCVAGAFLCLMALFVLSDFSVALVAKHSHSAKPLLFKIAGVWANHEGSMLLWILILSLFGAVAAWKWHQNLARVFTIALMVQGLLSVAFLLFLLFTSNPFERLNPVPFDGQGLNPLLQDVALAIHPPLLYGGYVGFSMIFSFALGALIAKQFSPHFARVARFWALVSWALLTLGIAMGSWWAYYELGWGGWWFWDPVENVSLMPWLSGTALLHCLFVVERRAALRGLTAFLAIMTFVLSLLGTFLVRSGILTSVHSFAQDTQRGVFILFIITFFTLMAGTVFALTVPHLRQTWRFAPLSREGFLVLNNLFLIVLTATVFIGTLLPLIMEILGWPGIAVGPSFYTLTFVPISLCFLCLLPLATSCAWQRQDTMALVRQFSLLVGLLVLSFGLFILWKEPSSLLPLAGMFLGVWIVMGTFMGLRALRALAQGNLPLAFWGARVAHLGVGLFVLAVSVFSYGKQELTTTMAVKDSVNLAGYTLSLRGYSLYHESNYTAQKLDIAVTNAHGDLVTLLQPEKRTYSVREQTLSEASIVLAGLGNLYAVMGQSGKDPTYFTLRFYYHPFAPLLWLSALVMVAGGLLSLGGYVGKKRGGESKTLLKAEGEA